LENTISCISGNHSFHLFPILTVVDVVTELDEGEREEFFRLKKVQGKKKRDLAKREAARAEKIASGYTEPTKPANLLEQGEDDLLFS
jgi:V-type H+-transporting ATPase subunit D